MSPNTVDYSNIGNMNEKEFMKWLYRNNPSYPSYNSPFTSYNGTDSYNRFNPRTSSLSHLSNNTLAATFSNPYKTNVRWNYGQSTLESNFSYGPHSIENYFNPRQINTTQPKRPGTVAARGFINSLQDRVLYNAGQNVFWASK
jgi:hypothetical protein